MLQQGKWTHGELKPQTMKNDRDYSLLFSFVKVTCTFLGHCLPCRRMCKNAVWKTKGSLWFSFWAPATKNGAANCVWLCEPFASWVAERGTWNLCFVLLIIKWRSTQLVTQPPRPFAASTEGFDTQLFSVCLVCSKFVANQIVRSLMSGFFVFQARQFSHLSNQYKMSIL